MLKFSPALGEIVPHPSLINLPQRRSKLEWRAIVICPVAFALYNREPTIEIGHAGMDLDGGVRRRFILMVYKQLYTSGPAMETACERKIGRASGPIEL